MFQNKLLSRKGWRFLSHLLLAVAGLGHLYYLSMMVVHSISEDSLGHWVFLGAAIAATICMVVLGSVLSKAELTNWG